jgi:hypothetical protein
MLPVVSVLSGILRIAACLHRTRQKRIRGIKVSQTDKSLEFVALHQSADDPEVELHTVQREVDLLEKSLGVGVSFISESC